MKNKDNLNLENMSKEDLKKLKKEVQELRDSETLKLTKFAKSTLSSFSFYDKALNWYDNIINSKYEYVVFVDEKTYALALALEKITGKEMSENIFTMPSFLAKVESDYNFFPFWGTPKVLCVSCDTDYLNEFNCFINRYFLSSKYNEDLKERNKELNKKSYDDTENIYYYSLMLAANRPRLTHYFNPKNYKCEIVTASDSDSTYEICKRQNDSDVNSLFKECSYLLRDDDSNYKAFRLSLNQFIEQLNISRNPYAYSIKLSNLPDNLETLGFQHLSYMGVSEYLKVTTIKNGSFAPAIFTLRLKKCYDGTYLLTPQIILKNLSDKLADNIIDFLGDSRLRAYYQNSNKGPSSKVLSANLVMAMASLVLETDFLKQIDYDVSNIKNTSEIKRLHRTYGAFISEDELSNMVGNILNQDLKLKDLASIFKKHISNEDSFKAKKNSNCNTSLVAREFEDFIINYDANITSYCEKGYNPNNKELPRVVSKLRYNHGIHLLLDAFLKDQGEEALVEVIKIVLLMEDSGCLNISDFYNTIVRKDKEPYYFNVELDTMAEFILPKNAIMHICWISQLERGAKSWHLDLKETITEFMNKNNFTAEEKKLVKYVYDTIYKRKCVSAIAYDQNYLDFIPENETEEIYPYEFKGLKRIDINIAQMRYVKKALDFIEDYKKNFYSCKR